MRGLFGKWRKPRRTSIFQQFFIGYLAVHAVGFVAAGLYVMMRHISTFALLGLVAVMAVAVGFVVAGVVVNYAAAQQDVSSVDATGEEIDERLKTLRREYYHAQAPSMLSSSLRAAMQGVSARCMPYYRHMLLAERSVYTILNTAPVRGLANPAHLLEQVQSLSRHIAVMVEHIQLADELVDFYEPTTREHEMVVAARERLIRRADRAMNTLEGVPARLLRLTAQSSSTGVTRLCQELEDVNARLEGMADAYATMEQPYQFVELEMLRRMGAQD
jgi:uncharacterized protein (DUF3084 family)